MKQAKRFLLSVLTLLLCTIMYAQQEITGTVTDAMGPVIGATAKDGMTVTMQEDALSLNEVVVTGYTTQRKADLTGAEGRCLSLYLRFARSQRCHHHHHQEGQGWQGGHRREFLRQPHEGHRCPRWYPGERAGVQPQLPHLRRERRVCSGPRCLLRARESAAESKQEHWMRWMWNAITTYNLEIGQHRADAMIGMEVNRQDYNWNSAKRYEQIGRASCRERV